MSRRVALLRGLNVGAHARLPMAELVTLFEDAGCTAVSTYIQSGNVVFEASAALAEEIPEIIARALREKRTIETPVVTRTAKELRRIAAVHPLAADVDAKNLHVGFLMSRPLAARVRSLDADRSPPDAFVVRGREIYLITPKGMARSKLTNVWFDRQLDTVSTFRNSKTVQALVERLD